MAAYFGRRLVGGVVTLFLGALVMHTLLWYSPGGLVPRWEYQKQDAFFCHHCSREFIAYTVDINNFDKPWPLSYLAWLFDPSESHELKGVFEGGEIRPLYENGNLIDVVSVQRGIDVTIFGLHIHGSGALTGNPDYSTDVARWRNVEDVLEGSGQVLLIALLMLLVSMGVVLLQRRGRPPLKDLPYTLLRSRPQPSLYRAGAVNELARVQLGGITVV